MIEYGERGYFVRFALFSAMVRSLGEVEGSPKLATDGWVSG